MFTYLRAIRCAGYAGFVLYTTDPAEVLGGPSACQWMIPGTETNYWDY